MISEVPTDQALCLAAPDDADNGRRSTGPRATANRRTGASLLPRAVAGAACPTCGSVHRPDDAARRFGRPSVWSAHEAQWRYAFQLLDEHLEKGVIRRAQVAAWFVPRAADEFWGRKLFLQLLSAPPPLTT